MFRDCGGNHGRPQRARTSRAGPSTTFADVDRLQRKPNARTLEFSTNPEIKPKTKLSVQSDLRSRKLSPLGLDRGCTKSASCNCSSVANCNSRAVCAPAASLFLLLPRSAKSSPAKDLRDLYTPRQDLYRSPRQTPCSSFESNVGWGRLT